MARFWSLFGCSLLCLANVATGLPGSAHVVGQFNNEARDVQEEYTAVPNGQEWHDTEGNPIRAYGGNYYEEDSTYYWVGQNLPAVGLQSSDDPAMIKCAFCFSLNLSAPSQQFSQELMSEPSSLYKSSDLLNWEKVGAVITVYTPDTEGNKILAWCRLERPKLMKSKTTGKYVIWIVSKPGVAQLGFPY